MSRPYRRWLVRLGPAALIGLVLGILLVAAAVLTPLVSGIDPAAQQSDARLHGPSWGHPLGFDPVGRDVMVRIAVALQVSLQIAFGATALAIGIGTVVGVVAALSRRTDAVLMRIVDVGLAFPRVFLLLVLFAFWSTADRSALVLVLGLTGWFRAARLVRGETLTVRATDYALAGVSLGLPPARLLRRHILPNIAAPIIVTATLGIGNVMLIETGLTYLGIGVSQPTPALGRMIADGTEYMWQAPRLAVIPGIAIMLTVLSTALVGDGLQRTLNPRTR